MHDGVWLKIFCQKIRILNISWFQNKKTKITHASMMILPQNKWHPMRFHKKNIDAATLFSNFSNNHFCLVTAHWSCWCSWWFIVDTANANTLHKTWFAFCKLTSMLVTEILAAICLRYRITSHKEGKFFFCAPQSSLDIKCWSS